MDMGTEARKIRVRMVLFTLAKDIVSTSVHRSNT